MPSDNSVKQALASSVLLVHPTSFWVLREGNKIEEKVNFCMEDPAAWNVILLFIRNRYFPVNCFSRWIPYSGKFIVEWKSLREQSFCGSSVLGITICD